MRRRIGKRPVVLALLAVVASLGAMLTPGVAYAGGGKGGGSSATFTMSHTSGQPGNSFFITQGTACPSGQSNPDYRVHASVTDANGSVVFDDDIFYGLPSTGVWTVDDGLSPVIVPTTAATGTATVRVWCRTGNSSTHLLDYTPQPYAVSGPPVDYTLTSSSYEVGETIRSDVLPGCENGVQGSLVHDSDNKVVAGWINLDSNVAVSQKIPHFFGNAGSFEETPTGNYTLNLSCYGADRGYFYAPEHIQVTEGVPMNYLAMGDSYSSGEGVEPFESGTDVPGTDVCHRSTKAYPRVLTEDLPSSFDLGADGFTACSGAETSAFTNSFNGEDPQLNNVFGNTDLITFTIGGNDMPFTDYATGCVSPAAGTCSEGSTAYGNAMAGIANDVIPGVQSALTSLKNKLDSVNNSNATVLVIGYPQLVPETWVQHGEGSECWWLDDEETPAIRDIVETLNTAVKNEVDAMGSNFHFVSATDGGSPFIGKELCQDSLDPEPQYFNNYNPLYPSLAYNFHPNEQGQQAYADLVKSYLVQNSLA